MNRKWLIVKKKKKIIWLSLADYINTREQFKYSKDNQNNLQMSLCSVAKEQCVC